VHGHMTSTASIYLPIVRKKGVFTIAHSRNAGVDKGIKGKLTKFLRRNLKEKCDRCFACSKIAGEAVFGKKAMEQGRVTIIPNAIDAARFTFDPEVRRQKREELHIQPEELLIGEVGRFDPQKNQKYAVEILAECRKKNFPAKLILIGEGPLMETVRQQVEERQLQEYVIFTGLQKNVVPFYQAMDFFLLPSFYEGLPGVAVEAQASGLRGILSDAITTEAAMTTLMEFRSVQEPAIVWADRIIACGHYERQNTLNEMQEAGFDVKNLAKRLQDFYLRVNEDHIQKF
jgi:glycosyltransferase involved in cell wall biosynthesis